MPDNQTYEQALAAVAAGRFASNSTRQGATYIGPSTSPSYSVAVYDWDTTYIGRFTADADDIETNTWFDGPDQPPRP
jgi:hypothetical protein